MDKTEPTRNAGLDHLRERIDEIDQQIVDLLAARKKS